MLEYYLPVYCNPDDIRDMHRCIEDVGIKVSNGVVVTCGDHFFGGWDNGGGSIEIKVDSRRRGECRIVQGWNK